MAKQVHCHMSMNGAFGCCKAFGHDGEHSTILLNGTRRKQGLATAAETANTQAKQDDLGVSGVIASSQERLDRPFDAPPRAATAATGTGSTEAGIAPITPIARIAPIAPIAPIEKRGPGRPKGSKNKTKPAAPTGPG